MLMSMIRDAAEAHADVCGLGTVLWLWLCLVSVLCAAAAAAGNYGKLHDL